MARAASITWPLHGLADDAMLASDGERLWVAASTAMLAFEEVWIGEVAGGGVAHAESVLPDAPCCRPAICAFSGSTTGALAVACSPDARIVAAFHDGTTVTRWQLALDDLARRATDGAELPVTRVPADLAAVGTPPVGVVSLAERTPVHLAAAAIGDLAWLAIEIAHGAERSITVAAVEPATGEVRATRQLGGGQVWCRWPALVADGDALIAAWCEGPALAPGAVRLAQWSPDVLTASAPAGIIDGMGTPIDLSLGEAPALALMPDGYVAIAWHRGGPSNRIDHRDASVLRAIDVAIVGAPPRADQLLVAPALPPAGAGGPDPRGEDQGWELPAVAVGPAGRLWLVGRSTHGHHVSCRAANGEWTAPTALDAGGWGARGRRHSLALHAGDLWLARRSPDGLVIEPCPEPAATQATIPAPIDRGTVARLPPRTVANVLFGDLHQHTAHSDGCGSFEDLWIAARDRRGLDFAAITDHDRFCHRAIGPATWRIASQLAAGFDDPGRFVALAAYEFTGARYPGPGHKCVYFGDRVPERVPDKDVPTLFAVLREVGGIAVPHHVGWTGGDFPHHDPELQPVWEICSVHGCYAGEGGCGAHPPRADFVIPGQFVRDALDAGLRFGFIGSTDSHGLDWHHGIARWRNPFASGLACLVGTERTRAGVLDALRARRSYATSGARIGLHVELEGAGLGAELPPETRGDVSVEVDGTARVTAIVLVHSGGELPLEIDARDTRASARGRVPDGARYVYVRIEQADGEAAWVSPWFL